jgi:hypothetical protein
MKIAQFVGEWNAFTRDGGVAPLGIDQKIALFQHWVTIRKDVASQQVKNKFWAGLAEGIIKRVRELVEKTPAPPGQVDTIKEMLSSLEEAMEEHRKNHPEG